MRVRQVLRMLTYYRRFVKDFSKIAAPPPLTALTRKNAKFVWTSAHAQRLIT